MAFLVSGPDEEPPAEPSERTDLVDCVHYYKDAMLGRFYAICSYCSCCCGAMQAHQRGTPMIASSGYVAQVEEELCAACGTYKVVMSMTCCGTSAIGSGRHRT